MYHITRRYILLTDTNYTNLQIDKLEIQVKKIIYSVIKVDNDNLIV